MSSERPTVICVLGPGRSGTSLTTRILNLLGVYLGPEDGFAPPSERANPKGFWERPWMSAMNNQLLHAQGGSLREPPPLCPGWETSDRLNKLRGKAQLMLEQCFGGHELWGWKDPRASFTLPFWKQLIPEMRYVICVRSPLDFAASVHSWGGWEMEETLSLWREFMAGAIANTAGEHRIFVAYDDFFADWRPPTERLARLAGCKQISKETERQIEDFIDADLRHHATAHEAVVDEDRVPADVSSLYLMVRRLASAEESGLDALAELEAVADVYARICVR